MGGSAPGAAGGAAQLRVRQRRHDARVPRRVLLRVRPRAYPGCARARPPASTDDDTNTDAPSREEEKVACLEEGGGRGGGGGGGGGSADYELPVHGVQPRLQRGSGRERAFVRAAAGHLAVPSLRGAQVCVQRLRDGPVGPYAPIRTTEFTCQTRNPETKMRLQVLAEEPGRVLVNFHRYNMTLKTDLLTL